MNKIQVEYKGTELGDIPKDWEIVSLVDVADPNKPYSLTGGPFGSNLKSEEYTESGVRIIQLQNIKEGYFSNDYKIYTSETKANQLFSCNIFPNDIIIAKMAEPVARACIMPNLNKRYLMASDGIRLAVNEEEYSTKYIMYAINSSYFRQQAVDNSTGTTRLRIGLKTLKGLKLLRPSKSEQEKITAILSSIDDTIEKTEAIIKQTKKVKKGLMQQLLIKGIGHTNFKNTKIGDIPEGWKLGTLKDYSEHITKGATPTTYGFDWVEEGVLFLRNECVKETGLSLKGSSFISEEAHMAMKRSVINLGDILITITGNLGQCCIYDKGPQEANINQHIARVRIIDKIVHPKFVSYFLNSDFMRKKYDLIKTGLAYPQLSLKQIQDIVIPIPSIEEQQQIVNILSGLEKKIEVEQLSLTQLKNLKRGLMQSLLTGRVRVKVDEVEETQV